MTVKEIELIEKALVIEVSIQCYACQCVETSRKYDIFAAEEFYYKGWRPIEGKIYCPKCAEKYGAKK